MPQENNTTEANIQERKTVFQDPQWLDFAFVVIPIPLIAVLVGVIPIATATGMLQDMVAVTAPIFTIILCGGYAILAFVLSLVLKNRLIFRGLLVGVLILSSPILLVLSGLSTLFGL